MFSRNNLQFVVAINSLSPASLEKARYEAAHPVGAIAATRGVPILPALPALPVIQVTRVVPFIRVERAVPVTPLPAVASFSYGPSVLTFCRDNLGKRIGTGQCASLASAALRNSGAATRGGPDWPAQGDYVWGDPVACVQASFGGLKGMKGLLEVEAGDIVQFHNTRFSGYNHIDGGVYSMEADHHTAVVESVDSSRKTITVLHQNWNGKMIVRRQMLFLGGMTRGWLRFYHPVPTTG
ncbi:MAG: CHAP domain-containing protein [Chthoniobacter sp.]